MQKLETEFLTMNDILYATGHCLLTGILSPRQKVPKFCRVAWLKGKTIDWESDTLLTLAINRQNKFQSEKDW
jgi:hypothetical protein